MKATTEFLKGMRVIKLWGWEDAFRNKLEALRGSEFRALAMNAALRVVNMFVINLCPLLVAVVTFGTCVLLGTPLTPDVVFTAIGETAERIENEIRRVLVLFSGDFWSGDPEFELHERTLASGLGNPPE